MASQDAVYATLLMTDSYLPGALVLGHSLRDKGAKARLVALVVIERLSPNTIEELKTVWDDIIPVQQMSNSAPANLYLMGRPDLISTFTKIELWRQTQYKRIVYLDADMVALRAPNELLRMDTEFAAVPDVGWPDCFNSGLMVLNPNMADYYALSALAKRGISFDGADQGLLNMHFTDWERLSFIYNCTPSANYQYVPAYKHYQSSINMIHFIGSEKPWRQGRDYRTGLGVYGELLARWWAVYDRHYRVLKPSNSRQDSVKQNQVYQYVKGEETRYEEFYRPQQSDNGQGQNAPQISARERRGSGGYQITQPRPQPVPGIHVSSPSGNTSAMEQPFSDQPSIAERYPSQQQQNYQAPPPQEERRWSAPHAEWDPARQPPPTTSKPEAEHFPTQQYEMSQSHQLFEPPTKYPEPPKDMWYSVPESQPQPNAPPKAIFPWEERGPIRATRVFPKSRDPTPSPPPEPELKPEDVASAIEDVTPLEHLTHRRLSEKPRQASLTQSIENDFAQQNKPVESARHIFPWEQRAPKATRVFADQEQPPAPPSNTHTVTTDEQGNVIATELARRLEDVAASQPTSAGWDAFAQQSNKWDDDPDIARFMESFNKPRKAKIQVVHDSRDFEEQTLVNKERRVNLKLTDFPTEIERPSLPVTPAPIRRTTVWGNDDPNNHSQAVLPSAQGVPRQDEWVRRFTSQYLSAYHPEPVLRDIAGTLHLTCQHCGKQNPIIKLEELQRRSSLVASGQENLITDSRSPPPREMPDSKSAEEAINAAIRAMTRAHNRPKAPAKSILQKPHFEVTDLDEDDPVVVSPSTTATGSKSPTRFNPIVLEGEAASERSSTRGLKPSFVDIGSSNTSVTNFDYSTNAISPMENIDDVTENDNLSPRSTAVA